MLARTIATSIQVKHMFGTRNSSKLDENHSVGRSLQEGAGKHDWLSAVLLLESSLIIVFNVLAIFLIFRKKRIYHMACNIFLTALLSSHVWIAIIGLIMFSMEYITQQSSFNRHTQFEKIILKLYVSSFTSSFAMVAIVTFDRLLAIKFSSLYNKISDSYKYPLFGISVAILLPFAFLALILTRDNTLPESIFVSTAIATSLFLVVVNFLCYRQSRHQIRRISQTLVYTDDVKQEHFRKYYLRNHKAARTCLLIVTSFIILWLPMGVTAMLRIIIGPRIQSKMTDNMRYVVGVLKYANSLADPVIYISVNKRLKREFQKTSRRLMNLHSSTLMQEYRDTATSL